ncbi:MAG: hypothetical protein LBV26_07820 [Bacteroidales bacterium]|jgi:Skp family chaperone for outer membrane proteins|nr:hypothetical protein [Bacteroidales bacterium]
MRRILASVSILLACLAPALAQENPRQDSIRAVCEAKKRIENYHQLPPGDKEKLKTLIEKANSQKKQELDSLVMCEDDTVCLKEIRTSLYRQYETLKRKIYLEKDENRKKQWQNALQNVIEQIIQVRLQLDSVKETVPRENLDFLKKLEEKYPYEVKMFENVAFSRRLKKLLGGRYGFLVKNFDVQTPIEIIDGIFIAFACRAHDCGTTDFMIAYDFARDALSAGVRENEQAKVYSENGEIPAKIAEWIH